MKSYTDIEQSKKLAEFLPNESADMFFWKRTIKKDDYAISVGHSKELQEGFTSKEIEYIPCWSLAALFNVLPSATELLKLFEHSYHCQSDMCDTWALNPIDACYEMIIKLHEQKFL